MYRSKDKKLMEGIKNTVLHVTRGQEKEDRKYAIDYLRTHVRMDDQILYAKKKFPSKEIIFGEGSLQPKLVIATRDPITPEQKDRLENVWKKMNLTENDIYYIHLRFVKTKKKKEVREQIFYRLLKMLAPKILFTFDQFIEQDKVEESVKLFPSAYPATILSDEEAKEERKSLTPIFKEIQKNVKQ